MLTVTNDAIKELDTYFEGKEKSPIRVYLAAGGCSGPSLALALDEAATDDTTFEENGYTFCINQELLDKAKTVEIDCSAMGFSVSSGEPLGTGGGCAGCGGGCAH